MASNLSSRCQSSSHRLLAAIALGAAMILGTGVGSAHASPPAGSEDEPVVPASTDESAVANEVPASGDNGRAAANASATLDVAIGVDGQVEQGDPLLVRVEVTARELVDGELVATVESPSVVAARVPIQVPAGSTKQVTVVVPAGWDNPRVSVSLADGGDTVATAVGRARFSTTGEFVGLLPRFSTRLGQTPDSVALGDGLGEASFAVVDAEVLDLGSPALRTFDTIVAGADDISSLTDSERRSLVSWMSQGGILVLDDDRAIVDLPEEWQPADGAEYALADLGEVRLSGGAAAGGRWTEIIVPTSIGFADATSQGSEMNTDPESDLAVRAGLALPSIGPLAIGLGVYALVIGPVLYFALRRSRRLTLGWAVIPLVALLTAGGVAVAGGGGLRRGHPAVSSFVQSFPGGSYVLANMVTFADRSGDATTPLPAGWAVATNTNGWWGDPSRIGRADVERISGGSSELVVSLESDQASVRLFTGTESAGSRLVTTAVVGDDGFVTGTATNDTEFALHAVALFVGTGSAKVGDLAAGATAEWKVKAPDDLRWQWTQRGTDAWPGDWGNAGLRADDPEVEFGIWGLASVDINLFPPGMARVVGWTDERPSPLIERPGDPGESVTAMSSLAPITSPDGEVNAADVRVTVVRSPFTNGVGTSMIVRYVLPAGHDPEGLAITGSPGVGVDQVEFWTGTGWTDVDDRADLRAVDVPTDAVQAGVVLARYRVSNEQGLVGVPKLTDGRSCTPSPRRPPRMPARTKTPRHRTFPRSTP
ncbi:hypothetical protein BH24ACT5_BH24ACT5_03140 [soil metagenome]